MKKIIAILLAVHCSLLTVHRGSAQIIHVPADQPTIQSGIDAANDGDTILVDPGTYLENINFNGKIITVASLFLITQDISYISQTVIDGNHQESVVTFNSGESPLALLCGFTLTNGANGGPNYACGGGINCISSSPWIKNVDIVNNHVGFLGGGIYCWSSDLILENVRITGNEVFGDSPVPNVTKCGGGIYCLQSNPVFMNVTIHDNYVAGIGGGIYCEDSYPAFSSDQRCNIYENQAIEGSDIFSLSEFDVILDTFSVMYPTDYYATPLHYFSFDILNGKFGLIDADLYISPSGDNSNSGLTPDDPLKNIFAAFPLIRADSAHKHTLYLSDGLYSPGTNGESFPVHLIDYVNLEGFSEAGVVLNADSTGSVMKISYNTTNNVANLTFTGGTGRGGIECEYSDPVLENLVISGNEAYIQLVGGSGGAGGGISFKHSNPVLNNILIENNFGGSKGGGIFALSSTIDLTDVILQNNTAGSGGGIYLQASEAIFKNVRITGNIAKYFCSQGGGIYSTGSSIYFDEDQRSDIHTNAACYGNEIWSDLQMQVVADTFTVQNPTEFLASPLFNFTFDILNPLFEQASADLFVSPDGNNFNSGLTAEDPLQTIHCALSKVVPDSQYPYTIRLLEGTYSDSSNHELFPLAIPDYVNLSGVSRDGVILDAENKTGVMHIAENSSSTICGMTIMRGCFHGITILNSDPFLENLVIRENYSCYAVGTSCWLGWGGGIFCYQGSPIIRNVIFENNWADVAGGSAYFEYSEPTMINVLITNDEYSAMSCSYSNLELANSTLIDHPLFLNYGSEARVVNSILWHELYNYGIILANDGNLCKVTISNSDIKNGQQGITGQGTVHWLEGNISDDPLFTGEGGQPYALSGESPCIDAGDPDTTGLFLPPGDLLGNIRVWDGNDDGDAVIDMGAYEYGADPVGVVENESLVPGSWLRVSCFPNPASGMVDFRWTLEDGRWVTLKIYDVHGREVATVLDTKLPAGEHRFSFDVSCLPDGMYFLQVAAGDEVASGKLVVLH